MVMSISCFVLQQLGKGWWLSVLAGGFAIWAPLFKPTGVSAIGAIGLFVVLQPLLGHRTWKQTGIDVALLLTGSAVALAPVYVWIIAGDVQMTLPYSFAWKTMAKMLPVAGAAKGGAYVSQSRKIQSFAQQAPRVLRYYGLLILPIAMAAGSIIIRIVKMIPSGLSKSENDRKTTYEGPRLAGTHRFVLLLAVWWLMDMAFVWISPRSYEQYYLPLNASAAMLGGYLIAVYTDKLTSNGYKTKWKLIGLIGSICMIAMSWHIFFGIEKSPHSGADYGQKRRGYAQKLDEISRRRKNNLKGPWEIVGQYIRDHSAPSDKIYVWGWFPGIYVAAQRVAPTAWPFTSEMHTKAPQKFAEDIKGLLAEFEQERPNFIVDSRKRHFPFNRPPLELWPIVPKGFMGMKKGGFLPLDKNVIEAYDKVWSEMLRERFDEDEALRYEVMKLFREFVMKNYKIVRLFGQHILFELKN